jgi:DNA repair protein RadC
MGVHDGHSQRMKKRFIRAADSTAFDDINALELLLFYALPRCDTNVVAHRLLDSFGSLSGVLEASMDELCQRWRAWERARPCCCGLCPSWAACYMVEKEGYGRGHQRFGLRGRYFVPRFMFETDEVVYIACLDSVHRVITAGDRQGSGESAEVSVRR